MCIMLIPTQSYAAVLICAEKTKLTLIPFARPIAVEEMHGHDDTY